MKKLTFALLIVSSIISSYAQSQVQPENIVIYCQSVSIVTPPDSTQVSTGATIVQTEIAPQKAIHPDSLINAPKTDAPVTPKIENTEKPKLKFAWGADLGASADMSGNDMSSIDLDLVLGMRYGWMNFLGIGAQANITVANSQRYYPLFVLFRTNFTNKPTHFFWEIKGGVSLNYVEELRQQLGGYAFTGCGINLARNKNLSSHLTIGYTWLQRRDVVGEETSTIYPDLHYATIKIGVTF